MKLGATLTVLTIGLLSAGPAMARDVFTEFTGTAALVQFLAPGTMLCAGGEPTPGPAPCSAGSRVQVRGLVFEQGLEATDPRVAGRLIVVMNANTDGWTDFGPGSGPMWGTVRLEVGGGGLWEGSGTGQRKVTPLVGSSATVRGEMHGTGGSIEG